MDKIDLGRGFDRTGARYGKMVVLRPHHQNERGMWFWECRCDCGGEVIRAGGDLTFAGDECSCGSCKLAQIGLQPRLLDGKRACAVCGKELPEEKTHRKKYHDECKKEAYRRLRSIQPPAVKKGGYWRNNEVSEDETARRERAKENEKFWSFCRKYNEQMLQSGKRRETSYAKLTRLYDDYRNSGLNIKAFAKGA